MGAAPFSTEVSMALVPFQVERSGGKLVTDLRDDHVVVMDGGETRKAKVYAVRGRQADAMPLDIAVLFDRSGSMRSGAGADPEIFRRGILEEFPTAWVAVYGFSNQLMQLTGPTRDEAELRRAMSQLNRFPAAGVTIYPVVVASAVPPPPPPGRKAKKGSNVGPMMAAAGAAIQFRHLSDTGGLHMKALPGTDNLAVLFKEMGNRLRDSYVAAYPPSEGERKVRVALRDPSLGKVIGGTRTVVR